jgi:hypothetical protein
MCGKIYAHFLLHKKLPVMSMVNNVELDVISAFENIFVIAVVQLTVDETNRYAQQEFFHFLVEAYE